MHQGYSQSRIVHLLKFNEIKIPQPNLSNIKRKVGLQRNSESKIKIFRTKSRLPASIINQVLSKIDDDNPPTRAGKNTRSTRTRVRF